MRRTTTTTTTEPTTSIATSNYGFNEPGNTKGLFKVGNSYSVGAYGDSDTIYGTNSFKPIDSGSDGFKVIFCYFMAFYKG